jgi:hypothetical protein
MANQAEQLLVGWREQIISSQRLRVSAGKADITW